MVKKFLCGLVAIIEAEKRMDKKRKKFLCGLLTILLIGGGCYLLKKTGMFERIRLPQHLTELLCGFDPVKPKDVADNTKPRDADIPMHSDDTACVPEDSATIESLHLMATKPGNIDAQYRLGLCYYEGRGVGKNQTEAVKWFRSAARLGHPDAQKKLRELGELW